jgi:hypothetical protein
MTFWDWFKQNGDKVFTFFSISAAAIQGLTNLSPVFLKASMICGILATAAHQSFFPNVTTSTTGVPPK